MRRIVIVGSTGSIGTQALDVIEGSSGLEVVGLAAASSWELLLEQARRFGVEGVALADADAAARAAEHATVLAGPEGLVELITDSDCDLVLNALVGSAGLGPTIATLGEGILSPLEFLADAIPLVRAGHERWDGTGYPDGLAGDEIPLGARVLLACDSYEAMITERPYRPALSRAEAEVELRRVAGSQLDPRVVEALIETL